MGFKENGILRGSTPIVSPFMTNLKRYTALYVYTDITQNQLVGDLRAPLLRVVPVKSRYGDTTCVTYEQPQFLPLSRSNIQTIDVNIRSNTGELVSFESGKTIVTLVFRRKSLFSLVYRLPAFKRAARQRGYGIGGIFKGLTRTFAPVVKKGLLNSGKQALQSGNQILDDVSRGEDVKGTIKRRAVEGTKKIGKKRISRAPTRKTASRKQTVTGSRLTATKKKKVSADIL